MKLPTEDAGDQIRVQYLLGVLSGDERDRFEDRYFSDDAEHDQLLAVEEELIDAYLGGELVDADRKLFEKQFLNSPERRNKVEFARALMLSNREAGVRPAQTGTTRSAVAHFPRRRDLYIGLAAIAAAILVGLAVTTMWRDSHAPAKSDVTKSGPKPTRPPEESTISPERQVPAPPPKAPQLLAFVLRPSERGVGGNVVTIPPGNYRVRLRLRLDAVDFENYQATVEANTGRAVFRERLKKPATGSELRVTVPSDSLPAGDYVLKLTGLPNVGNPELVAGYSFYVKRD